MQLVIAPDKRLRVKTKPVKKIDEAEKKIVEEMVKLTKTFRDPEGVGLATTQIGRNEQLFIALQPDNSFKAYFNPKIINFSPKTKLMFEGCLSIPNYWGEVERHIAVTVEYTDINGNQVKERLTGLLAHIFQHECDHLQGILFMDHITRDKNKLYKVVGKDQTGTDVFEEVEP